MTPRPRRVDPGLACILLVAALLRLQAAATQPYVHDEENTAIPLSRTISFTPGQVHLPLRGENHGALPAYVVKASSHLFGESKLGYRALHVVLGLATIALVFLMARAAFGVGAAHWAAALMAANDYFLGVSTRATAHVPHLMFVALALYGVGRFLSTHRAGWLYGAALALGAAFYCKESSALLVPLVGLVIVLSPGHRGWLRRPAPYLACAAFAAVIAVDVVWNSRATGETARVSYSGQTVEQATYRRHLERIGGLGLSPYPLMFYLRQPVQAVATALRGTPLTDETPEYPSVNPLLGLVLLGGFAATLMAPGWRRPPTLLYLSAFAGVFLFFMLIARGTARGRMDAVSWIWVETTILPAAVLAGARLGGRSVPWRLAGRALAVAGLVWASADALRGWWRLAGWAGEEGWAAVNHAWQVLAINLVVAVRARPLVAVAIALAAGVATGLALGVLLGRRVRRRPPGGD